MTVAVAEETYDFKKLFYMACGYISATDMWKEKHPIEVVDFFLAKYIEYYSCEE